MKTLINKLFFQGKIKKQQQQQYDILNKKFRDKHQLVCNYYIQNYLGNGKSNCLNPLTEEGKKYQNRLRLFFREKYSKLPFSFDPWSTIDYKRMYNEYYPVEKLQNLYDEIELEFPEPFNKK
jgi:hypothetical protein